MPSGSPGRHIDFKDSSPQPLQSEELVHEKIEIADLHPFFQFAYAEAQEGFSQRINMSEFTNRKDLAHDVSRVNEKLAMIRATCVHGTESEKMAIVQSDVFEYMLHRHIGEAAWFGESVKSILPSIYDDLYNGTDLILEQHIGRGAYAFSALGIDVTFSADGASKKIDKTIGDYLSKGKLGKVKYFKSERAGFKGGIDGVPHFVIGMGRPALFEMLGQYVQKGPAKDINQEAQRMILEQIVSQAHYFEEFLKSKGFVDGAAKYALVGEEMSQLLDKTTPLSNKKGIDEVHQVILGKCLLRK